jgi:hypothetical protein
MQHVDHLLKHFFYHMPADGPLSMHHEIYFPIFRFLLNLSI